MAEKNILAYFRSPEDAQHAASKLRSLRVIDLAVDRFSAYPGEGMNQVMNPLTGDFASLGNLTLDADFSNKSAAVLAAADPAASGMSDGGDNEVTGYDTLLTVIVDEHMHDKAVAILEEAGARL